MAQGTPARPNIIVIMTDDQRLDDLRALSKTRARIGAAGTTFTRSFSTFPACAPARASYLTGQYSHNNGVRHNVPPNGGYPKLDHRNTLPVWLQEAGYFTTHIGKYLNLYGQENPTEIPPGWDDWQGIVDPTTYRMYDYTMNDNGALVRYKESEADYQTDVLAARAENAIAKAVARKQPFFLEITPLAPHGETTAHLPGPPNPRPAPRHAGAFANAPLPQAPAFDEADVSDKPAFIRALPRLTTTQIKNITACHRSRLAALLAVDDLVERVVDKLVTLGVLRHTMLIFTSDNGFFHGEHRINRGKYRIYEESGRVPLLIRGGGFPRGVTAQQLVAHIDLAPTIVALSGATPKRVMDGRSLLPLALNPKLGGDRNLLIETVCLTTGDNYQAVRSPSFLYVEHPGQEQELYDLRPGAAHYDPHQLNSRHASSTYTQIKSQLATRLNQLRACSGTSCGVA
jgi:N-acetylglucosamine-6-sulfatase